MAQTPVVPLAGWPELRSASRTGRDAEGPVCEQIPVRKQLLEPCDVDGVMLAFPLGPVSSGAWRCWVSCSFLLITELEPKPRTRIRSSSSGQTLTTGPFVTTLTMLGRIRVQAFPLHGLIHPLAVPDRPHP